MDMAQLMKAAGELQTQLRRTQDALVKLRVTGEAGGGLVRVVLNGQHEVLEVTIDPSALADKALLEDLVRAALNHANKVLVEQVQGQMGDMAGGAGLGMDLKSLFGNLTGGGGGER